MSYKKSKQRDRMLELLQNTDTHPTADWLFERLKQEFPNLSFGTVYRNLGILQEQGLLKKIPFGSTHDRYEARITPHYHLICERCGRIEDFEMPLYDDLNEQAGKLSAFNITSHRIDFFGVCGTCKKNKRYKERKHGT